MSEGKRSRLSLTQRSEIWSRWKSGQSLHEIGRAFGKPHTSIRCLLLPRGGIPPAARRRSRLALIYEAGAGVNSWFCADGCDSVREEAAARVLV
jgi:Helix-turn-helix domain